MRDFYLSYYRAVATSRAHAKFCEYAYGEDLCQHGFMTLDNLEFLLRVMQWSSQTHVLDVGCGNGRIATRIAEESGAHVDGLDYIPEAIRCARGHGKRSWFFVADLNRVPCAPQSFDALLSVDSLYFSTDYCDTLSQWIRCIKPGGQLAIFYSHGANPEQPKAIFDKATIAPDKTPLGTVLRVLGLSYEAWDFTASDYALAERKQEILGTLRDEFEAEGNMVLYNNRLGEASGIMDAIESGMHARYLYRAQIGLRKEQGTWTKYW